MTLPKIQVERSYDRGKSWEVKLELLITKVITVFGRANDCDVTIDFADNYVSKYHCTTFRYKNELDLQIEDGKPSQLYYGGIYGTPIYSTSGTIVNAKKLEPGEKLVLKHGDIVTLVPRILRLVYIRPTDKESDKLDETFIPSDQQE